MHRLDRGKQWSCLSSARYYFDFMRETNASYKKHPAIVKCLNRDLKLTHNFVSQEEERIVEFIAGVWELMILYQDGYEFEHGSGLWSAKKGRTSLYVKEQGLDLYERKGFSAVGFFERGLSGIFHGVIDFNRFTSFCRDELSPEFRYFSSEKVINLVESMGSKGGFFGFMNSYCAIDEMLDGFRRDVIGDGGFRYSMHTSLQNSKNKRERLKCFFDRLIEKNGQINVLRVELFFVKSDIDAEVSLGELKLRLRLFIKSVPKIKSRLPYLGYLWKVIKVGEYGLGVHFCFITGVDCTVGEESYTSGLDSFEARVEIVSNEHQCIYSCIESLWAFHTDGNGFSLRVKAISHSPRHSELNYCSKRQMAMELLIFYMSAPDLIVKLDGKPEDAINAKSERLFGHSVLKG